MGRPRLKTPEKYCEVCGKKLERRKLKSGYEEPLYWFNKRKYCSLECSAKARKLTDYKESKAKTWGGGHGAARRLFQETDMCADCGKHGKTEIHHIDENYLNNAPENLVRLCKSCHAKRHRKRSLCIVCGLQAKAKNLCSKHYQQYRKGKLELIDQSHAP